MKTLTILVFFVFMLFFLMGSYVHAHENVTWIDTVNGTGHVYGQQDCGMGVRLMKMTDGRWKPFLMAPDHLHELRNPQFFEDCHAFNNWAYNEESNGYKGDN